MKRIASTSRLAYGELQSDLQPREHEVLAALRGFASAPTAYELLDAMRGQHPGFDVNSIRPRLTSLRDKGLIVGEQKRRCQVTGRLAWTWSPADPRQLARSDNAGPAVQERARRHQTVLDFGWGGR